VKETIHVCDNFLRGPERLIDEASGMAWVAKKDGSQIRKTARSRYASEIERRYDRMCGRSVNWSIRYGSGTYRGFTEKQILKSGGLCEVHADVGSTRVFIIYLNRPDECHGGTGFYRHKQTGLESPYDWDVVSSILRRFRWTMEDLGARLLADSKDPSKWVLVDMVSMRFNRLLVMDGRRFHSHILDFHASRCPAARRLTMMSFGA
jgi:hypothetical protein